VDLRKDQHRSSFEQPSEQIVVPTTEHIALFGADFTGDAPRDITN
jgi:hypothetical protein